MKKYRLNTTTFVTACDATNPLPKGSVWQAKEEADMQEGDALVRAGFAEETQDKATHETLSARLAGKPKADPPISAIVEKPIRKDDGTFVNKNGVQVNEDGSEIADPEAELKSFLANKAEDVIKAIEGVSGEGRAHLPRLRELEAAGKDRSTVLAAIDAAVVAKPE